MRRLWIVSHFDRDGEAAAYFLSALRAYRKCGGEILVVSTADLSDAARKALKNSADEVIERENVGLDFASWRQGLDARNMGRGYDEIIIANDSVFGPLADIAPILRRLSDPDTPILGMTINREVQEHIQSWFVGFNMRVFPRALFENYWAGVEALSDKSEIIHRYEIGLSGCVTAARLPLAAAFDMRAPRALGWWQSAWRQIVPENLTDVQTFRELRGAQRTRLGNPTMYHWHELLRAGVPYVKIELMRDNPIGMRRSLIRSAIANYGVDACRDVFEHLARLSR